MPAVWLFYQEHQRYKVEERQGAFQYGTSREILRPKRRAQDDRLEVFGQR
ncbi:MAG TPA: hypothetical protein VM912_07370 [Terriglobales bacterium]|nr:hypothetical protein [Terriglobales bacterium]